MRAESLIGQLIVGDYKILSLLGQGGMGAVYLAEQNTLSRKVAIKIIQPPINEELKLRFQREGLLLARLDHANIVRLYSFGLLEDQSFYLVMEYLDGQSLAKRLQQCQRLSLQESLKIAMQIALGLAHMHEQGVTHRDLKPENIMLCTDAEGKLLVKLLDLGLAKACFESGAAVYDLTKSGLMVGTPHYMSPEQCLGKAAEPRSDIYALGVLLYRCLSGSCPFDAETAIGVLHKHVHDPLPPPSFACDDKRLEQELQSLLLKSMSKDPEQRYQSAMQMFESMQGILEASRDELPDERVQGTDSSRQAAASANYKIAALTIFLIAAFCGAFVWRAFIPSKGSGAIGIAGSTLPARLESIDKMADELKRLNASGAEANAKRIAVKALNQLSNLKTADRQLQLKELAIFSKIATEFNKWQTKPNQDSRLDRTLDSLKLNLFSQIEDYEKHGELSLAFARIFAYNQDSHTGEFYARAASDFLSANLAERTLQCCLEAKKRAKLESKDHIDINIFSFNANSILNNAAEQEKLLAETDALFEKMPPSPEKALRMCSYAGIIAVRDPEASLEMMKEAEQMAFNGASSGLEFYGIGRYDSKASPAAVLDTASSYAGFLLARGDLKGAEAEYEKAAKFVSEWENEIGLSPESSKTDLGRSSAAQIKSFGHLKDRRSLRERLARLAARIRKVKERHAKY